jgi:hypothetical protein
MGRDKQTDTPNDDPGRKQQFGRIAAWTEPKPTAPKSEPTPPEKREQPDETEAA